MLSWCSLWQAQEAETTYKACIHEANAKQQELLKVKVSGKFHLSVASTMCSNIV